MTDFKTAREKMVDCQVRTSDVTSHSLLQALLSVPREAFVPEDHVALAYIDQDLELSALGSEGRYLMAPAKFAKLAQVLEVNSEDVVLVVGAGSGYSSAVFSLMGSSVVAIESADGLVNFASNSLSSEGFDNVVVMNGSLVDGFDKEAPYDAIFIEGSVDFVPQGLLEQLSEGGRLVAVTGQGNAARARVFEKRNSIIGEREVMNCSLKPLPGFEHEEEFVF